MFTNQYEKKLYLNLNTLSSLKAKIVQIQKPNLDIIMNIEHKAEKQNVRLSLYNKN